MNISEPFVRRPIATSLLMGGILLIGIVAWPLLPVAPLPQVDFPTLVVTAQLPGASPETMASSVATPLEYQFAQIPGLSQMTSTSVLGTAQITLQFGLDRNINAAAQDIQTAIDAAGGQLPKNLPSPPTYKKVNPADSPILILAVHSDVLPLTTVDDYCENVIAQRLSQVSGVASVTLGGQQKPAVRVQVDPAKIAALGIQLEDVASVIGEATVNAPKGSINGALHSFAIYDNDQLLKAAPWNDVVVAYKNGAPVRIRDIGIAVDAAENNQLLGWQNNKNGILLLVFKQAGANVIDVVANVKSVLPKVLLSVPPSIKVDQVVDRTTTIKASVHDVEFTLVLTIALVVMVIFLFLRTAWATIIPGVTVPLSLLGTAALMYVVGYSLDNLSLMALTIAVGFVVDDAIVMLENIYRHIEDGTVAAGGDAQGLARDRLHHPVDQHLAGGGIHPAAADGRHRRPAVPRVRGHGDDDDRGVGIRRADAVADDVRAVPAQRKAGAARAACTSRSRPGSTACWRSIRAAWTSCCAISAPTLIVFVATVALTVVLYVLIPKGFFPQQDTGIIVGLSDAPQDISFERDGATRASAHRRAGPRSGRRELGHGDRRLSARSTTALWPSA